MTLVKICGITTVDDARRAAEAGADLVGVVLAESPRRVTPDRAAEICAVLPRSIRRVGVFVNAPSGEIRRIARHAGFDMVQLHGGETAEQARAIGIPVLKAFRVASAADVEEAGAAGFEPYLLDGPPGGSLDLDLACLARGRFLLAGGLTPGTVREALGRIRPHGVDVSRGVETSPGRKDAAAMRLFVSAVRAWDATEGTA